MTHNSHRAKIEKVSKAKEHYRVNDMASTIVVSIKEGYLTLDELEQVVKEVKRRLK